MKMIANHVALAVLCVLLSTGVAIGLQQNEQNYLYALGEQIYNNGPQSAPGESMGGDVQQSCRQCHQRSGLGASEGNIVAPPIAGLALFQPRRRGHWELNHNLILGPNPRPAYTRESFAQALRTGVDGAGRTLHRLMPRYDLDDTAVNALLAYLSKLSKDNAPGVFAETLRFATIVTEDATVSQRQGQQRVIDTFLNDKNRGYRFEHAWSQNPVFYKERKQTAYREWQVDTWELRGGRDTWRQQLDAYYQQRPVFALLGGVSNQPWKEVHRFCEERQVPCILPSTDQPIVTNSDFYSLYFSAGVELEAQVLAKYLRQQELLEGRPRIVQVHDGSVAAARAMKVLKAKVGDVVAAEHLVELPVSRTDQTSGREPNSIINTSLPVATHYVLWLDPQLLPGVLAKLAGRVGDSKVFASSSLIGYGQPVRGTVGLLRHRAGVRDSSICTAR